MSAETRETLSNALRAHSIEAWEGDLVTDWVIVAALINTDGTHSIGVEASRDPMPQYVTVGLLTEGMRVTDPDDD